MSKTIRLALAAQAYAEGVVRLVTPDIAGFDHLVTTRHGLFAVSQSEHKLIAYGKFYGLTIDGNTIWAFEACDRPRARTGRGRLVRFVREASRIVSAEVVATGLSNGCHQLDLIDGRLHLIDTYEQAVLRFTPDVGTYETLRPLPLTGHDGSEGYVHLNSIFARGDDILLLRHNGGARSGLASDIAVFDRDWRLTGVEPLDGMGCHNFALLEDGTLLSCGSLAGELIGSDGLKRKLGNMMTRGLSVGEDRILVGGSVFAGRGARDELYGAIYSLDRACRSVGTVQMPAPVMEIRRIDGRDRSLSSFVATQASSTAAVATSG